MKTSVQCTFMIRPHLILLRMKSVSEKKKVDSLSCNRLKYFVKINTNSFISNPNDVKQ